MDSHIAIDVPLMHQWLRTLIDEATHPPSDHHDITSDCAGISDFLRAYNRCVTSLTTRATEHCHQAEELAATAHQLLQHAEDIDADTARREDTL
ncbi:hypothetical protein KFR76_07950 [Corynebacterium diphtheriae]|nr:hypothetical protein KFR76_07950 [Corynebacterium diphtheriae]